MCKQFYFLIHHRGAPIAQLARAFGWFGRAGFRVGATIELSRVGFMRVFI